MKILIPPSIEKFGTINTKMISKVNPIHSGQSTEYSEHMDQYQKISLSSCFYGVGSAIIRFGQTAVSENPSSKMSLFIKVQSYRIWKSTEEQTIC